MALTPSNMLELGAEAAPFTLQDTISRSDKSLDELKGENGTLIMFICNHCPFVVHVIDELVKLGHDYQSKGINLIAISSNSIQTHPHDGPEKMTEMASQKQFPFPYLYDESQETAKAYKAACTPDFYLFDAQLKLVYRGQLDDSRPSNGIPVSGSDMRQAMDQLIAGDDISSNQLPSIGCNIKWHP